MRTGRPEAGHGFRTAERILALTMERGWVLKECTNSQTMRSGQVNVLPIRYEKDVVTTVSLVNYLDYPAMGYDFQDFDRTIGQNTCQPASVDNIL